MQAQHQITGLQASNMVSKKPPIYCPLHLKQYKVYIFSYTNIGVYITPDLVATQLPPDLVLVNTKILTVCRFGYSGSVTPLGPVSITSGPQWAPMDPVPSDLQGLHGAKVYAMASSVFTCCSQAYLQSLASARPPRHATNVHCSPITKRCA